MEDDIVNTIAMKAMVLMMTIKRGTVPKMWHLCEKKRTGDLMNVDARSLEDAGQRNGPSLDITPLHGNED